MMMTITDLSNTYNISLRGEYHRLNRTKNQDAVMVKEFSFGKIIAVADGLGSHRFSRNGSRAVVLAVKQSFLLYKKHLIPREKITETIGHKYYANLRPKHKIEAATTCIFAAYIYGEGVFIGQVGDGCAYVSNLGSTSILKAKDDEFSNLVVPLSYKNYNKVLWTTRFIKESKIQDMTIILATDGISEDIVKYHENEFVEYIKQLLGFDNKHVGKLKLKEFLRDWPSGDDKTMAILRIRKL